MNGGPLRARRGFTFVEVIILLLVIGVGLMGVVGLVSYGMRIAAKSQGETTGLITAVSVARDPAPLLAPETAGDWTFTPYDMDGTGTLTSRASGFINGYWVVRTETSTDADIVARDGAAGAVQVRSAQVAVEVYGTINGTAVASYSTRLVGRGGGPCPAEATGASP